MSLSARAPRRGAAAVGPAEPVSPKPLAGPGSAKEAWFSGLPPTVAPDSGLAADWSKFERRRHRMQPPNLFDEAAKKFDRLGEPSSPSDGRVSSSPSRSPRSARCAGETPAGGVSTSPDGASPAEDADMNWRKAHFYANCLRADRAVGDLVKLPLLMQGRAPPVPSRRRGSTQGSDEGGSAPPSPTLVRKTTSVWANEPPPTLQESMAGLVNSCKQAKMLPNTRGIIRNDEAQLHLEFGSMTDVRAQAMSQALRASASTVKDAYFRSNGLTAKGAKCLLEALPAQIQSIDLSSNELLHCDVWCSLLNRFSSLQRFNVSDGQLGDNVCKALCEGLTGATQLVYLNLSGNDICHAGVAIGTLVRSHRHLAELDLHWNRLAGDGARELLRGICENCGKSGGSLRRLDLAWNPLGKAGGEEHCKQLAQVFRVTKNLRHIDLSMCDFTYDHCRILADGLDDNHTILGVHVAGNSAKMTPFGRMLPTQDVSDGAAIYTINRGDLDKIARSCRISKELLQADPPADAEDFARKLRSGDYRSKSPQDQRLGAKGGVYRSLSVESEYGSCCWVCEHWRETRITYTPGISGPAADDVWVFTSVDGFEEPTKLVKSGADLVTHLMLPAGQLRLVFQVGTEVIPSRTAPLVKDMNPGGPPLRLRRVKTAADEAAAARVADAGAEDGGAAAAPDTAALAAAAQTHVVEVRSGSRMEVVARRQDEEVCTVLQPRTAALATGAARSSMVSLVPLSGAPAVPWDIERSLFAPYEEALLRKGFCDRSFDLDWKASRLDRLLQESDDRLQVKDVLRGSYAELSVLYSSLCSVQWCLVQRTLTQQERPLGFGIGLHEFSHMVVQHGLVGEAFPIEDADAQFIKAAVPSKDSAAWHPSAQTDGTLLLRHGYFEVLVRIAMCWRENAAVHNREHRTGGMHKTSSVAKVLEYVVAKHLLYPHPAMKNNFKAVQWRVDVLHTEVVEAVLRKHLLETIEPLLVAFGTVRVKGQHILRLGAWFAVLDWLQVLPCMEAEVGNRAACQMAIWDRVWLWRISAMAHVDEVSTDENVELSLVEFLEALARLVALLRSRDKVASASVADLDKWDYGLGAPSAPSIFCADREGVCDKDTFARNLSAFLDKVKVSLKRRPPEPPKSSV